MRGLVALREAAEESCLFRGHALHWVPPYHGERKSSQSAFCIRCGAWVQVDTQPDANGIDIGGPAVALSCGPMDEHDTWELYAEVEE